MGTSHLTSANDFILHFRVLETISRNPKILYYGRVVTEMSTKNYIRSSLNSFQIAKKALTQSGLFIVITSAEFNRFDDSENAKNAD